MPNIHHLDVESAWALDCQHYWGRLLTGTHRHWCPDWDMLPIDETCTTEYSCCTCTPPAHPPISTVGLPLSD